MVLLVRITVLASAKHGAERCHVRHVFELAQLPGESDVDGPSRAFDSPISLINRLDALQLL